MATAVRRAVSFTMYGGSEVLSESLLPLCAPGEGELVLRVAAAALNPGDVWTREGRFKRFMPVTFPFVPGYDVAGFVEAVGPGVTTLRVGDRAFAMMPLAVGGGYAERALVKAAHAAPAPSGSFINAAAMPLTGLTALQGLRDGADIRANQRLLIFGAAGGVGHMAVQIAKILGARVTAVASAARAEFLRSLGADEVVDRTNTAALDALEPFDVVFDAVSKLPFDTALRWLRPGGTFLTVHPVLAKMKPDLLSCFRGGKHVRSVFVKPDAAGLNQLREWADAGRLSPTVTATFKLKEAARAMEKLEVGNVQGKLVFDLL